MPSMQLKVNFKKGWPNPYIVENTAAPDTGVTVEAGMIGYIDKTSLKWKLGDNTADKSLVLHIFQNDSGDPDAARGEVGLTNILFKQVPYGGVHGIALTNALEIETIQFTGTPAVGDELSVASTGKLQVATSTQLIVGVCTEASHKIGGSTFITFIPEVAKRVKP